MENQVAFEYEVKNKKLVCPHCGKNKFWTRQTLMNTRASTFFGFDWANRKAQNYICDNCGYVFWFFDRNEKVI